MLLKVPWLELGDGLGGSEAKACLIRYSVGSFLKEALGSSMTFSEIFKQCSSTALNVSPTEAGISLLSRTIQKSAQHIGTQ